LALRTATPLSEVETGAVGVGTGAQWGKITGEPRDGGFYLAQVEVAGGTVTAAVVVNAMGVIDPDIDPRGFAIEAMTAGTFGQNTTLIAVITDVACGHHTLKRMCVAAHDALARVIWPSHTVADGDVAFASTLNESTDDPALVMPLCLATELAVEAALRAAKHP
jgi:L-aminopeptidase/D-esterase-like protein